MMLECEKRSVGRQIDIDSFLLFMVDMWRDEQQRVEVCSSICLCHDDEPANYCGCNSHIGGSRVKTHTQTCETRSQERMRSLFVGADANADGNLDFDEFMQMVNNVKTDRPRRELLKMFSVCIFTLLNIK